MAILAFSFQRTSQNLGAGYNAPECTKPSAYTLKSDIYSFGVVMLELLTGRMPFDRYKMFLLNQVSQWLHFDASNWHKEPIAELLSFLLYWFHVVQNQDQSNAWSTGLRHSSSTLMLWRKWLTRHSVDSILPSLSPDLLMLLHFVYR